MMYSFITVFLFHLVFSISAFKRDSLSILMPGVSPDMPDAYLCSSQRIDPTFTTSVVNFSPNATMRVVHHMLLYGCSVPGGVPGEAWNCGGMSHHHMSDAGPCSKGQQIIYAWARDAPALDLPDGVAFQIGGDTAIQYLTIQVHYADVSAFKDGQKDDSGVIINFTKSPLPRSAGIYLLWTDGHIPPSKTEYMETACQIHEDKVIHPFAFRTHTHDLGRVVSGYHVRRDNTGVDHWTLVGKKDPMLPQMFYPVENNVSVKKDDILAARCTMVNNRTTSTEIGYSKTHEMCNFYIMYWIEGSSLLETKDCPSVGPPSYYWSTGNPDLNNIPSDKEVSSI